MPGLLESLRAYRKALYRLLFQLLVSLQEATIQQRHFCEDSLIVIYIRMMTCNNIATAITLCAKSRRN